MNRLSILILIGFACLLASCGSSVSSSTQPELNQLYSMVVTPIQFTMNAGDTTKITATVDLSVNNGAAEAISPQPAILYNSSSSYVTVAPDGTVCAGQWDAKYISCTPASTIPTGYVTITAYNASHNVAATTLVSVHVRAARITLSAPVYTGAVTVNNGVSSIPAGQYPSVTNCVSQNNSVQFTAAPVDANGIAVGNVFDDDYVWTTDNPNVAQVNLTGKVVAVNPGVTNVYATLDGTVSVPLAFVTCPPSSIVLSTSNYISNVVTGPYSTADLDPLSLNPLGQGPLNKGNRENVTASLTDVNGLPLNISPLNYITSDPLTASFSSTLPLTATLSTNTSGRITMTASCGPPNCNPAVADFTSPAGPGTGQGLGFGYPIYSNVVGVTVEPTTTARVLVTGTTLSDGVTPAHRLLVYDSDSMSLITQNVSLVNVPNSLVVDANGATAYVGSSDGLMVVNLANYSTALAQTLYPIVGGVPTDEITGQVLGVSQDSRYVLVSDVPRGLVFLTDTTGTKTTVEYSIPNITSVTFAPDDSNIWIGGMNGVYQFQADVFVPISSINAADTSLSTDVGSLAWMPDGQSYFASGDQLTNYSTCQDQKPQSLGSTYTSTVTQGLSTTALSGVTHLLGLDGDEWFDYPVTSTSKVAIQSNLPSPPPASGTGNVCLSGVTIQTPVHASSTLACTAQQVSFAPILEEEFVTGVNPSCASPETVIHGYQVGSTSEFTLNTLNSVSIVPLSGGVLNDGRYLYVGSSDSTNGSVLHRFDLSAGTPTPGAEDTSVPVSVVPSFVAVVP